MKLIVGLGNPGKEYENTRHNLGFMVLDNYIKQGWKKKNNSLIFEATINENKIVFLKPQTFMNNSGISVKKFVDFFNIEMKDLLIIHDDLDLNTGILKIKNNCGDGGHNGIKSIVQHLKSGSFNRLKIGISNNKLIDTKDYVTGKFNKEELEIINNNMKKYCEVIDSFISNDVNTVMNEFNKKES